jgi:pSer/pThr/pTyr-binding forkhead associated (FHA) protein
MSELLTTRLNVVCPSCDFLNATMAARCTACGSSTELAVSHKDGPRVPRSSGSGVVREIGAITSPSLPTFKESDDEAQANLARYERARDVAEQTPAILTDPDAHPVPEPVPTVPSLPSSVEPKVQPPMAASASAVSRTPQVPVAASPSGILKGPPARPSFQSSASQVAGQQSPAPRFGLSIVAGPMRGQRFRVGTAGAQIGRSRGLLLFPEDPFISPLHATLFIRDGQLYLRDEASTSGVYVSINNSEVIPANTAFCAGARLFRYLGAIEPSVPWNRTDLLVYGAPLPTQNVHFAVEEVMLGDRSGRCIVTEGPILTIGQTRCDFTFPSEEGLAARHCELIPKTFGAVLRDLSGGLGTFVRVVSERKLVPGERFRVGQQTLQVDAI